MARMANDSGTTRRGPRSARMPRRRQSIAYTLRDLLPVLVFGSPIVFLLANPWKS